MKILSTKKLSDSQQLLLKDFTVTQTSMINISYGENFKVDEPVVNAIFTSANSVKSVFKIHQNKTDWFNTVYCVGNKTQSLLQSLGITVSYVANNALELADYLANKFAKETQDTKQVNWFCGNLRNNDLPTVLAENGVLVTEYIVYKTTFDTKKVEEDFDAILFYSPSGVKSYVKENKIPKCPIICIGVTTATEAVKHFENVYISEQVSVESVINKVKEILSI